MLRQVKLLPSLVAAGVLLATCALEFFPHFPLSELARRLEWISYDWRVRYAIDYPRPVATNLGAVFIDDRTLNLVNAEYNFKWPWPTFLHAHLVEELAAQNARRVAFDVLFAELGATNSDQYFAAELRRANNVALAAFGDTTINTWNALMPAELFRTNTLVVGHATSDPDSDGVLRRAKAFKDDPRHGRLWHLGILLAAAELKLDLDHAEVQPDRIILRGESGVTRVIPLDSEGFFHIDWSLAWNDKRLTIRGFEDVENNRTLRARGEKVESPFQDKLVFVGSLAAGNNISDLGPTPLGKTTYLLSKHWNVANSVITGAFIHRTSVTLNLALILVFGGLGALATWNFRPLRASLLVVAMGVAFGALAVLLFVQLRLWLPIVLPVGGLVVTHVATVTYRLVFEERETRRVRNIFSRLVSPEVVTELLAAENLHLGGARRRITVFFADVRGFTEMTDSGHAKAEEYVRTQGLVPQAAEEYYDQRAREMLSTVNSYLATIADQIKKHGGTLDKYIGDCVMAFWGAPIADERHAAKCVHSAIDAQRAIYELNQQRFAENKRREEANAARLAAGQTPLPLLPLLTLGTGINTGTAVVGLMGSEEHTFNYTVFGREVNIASRLESISGRGRIFISEATYLDLKRDEPDLAATCVAQNPQILKGIQGPVKVYEVPWKVATPAPAGPAATAPAAATPAAPAAKAATPAPSH